MLARLLILAIIIGLFIWLKRLRAVKRQQQNTPNQTVKSAAMSQADALDILGLQEPCSTEEIEQAYKKLMNRVHPDKGGTNYLANQINQAREILLRENKD